MSKLWRMTVHEYKRRVLNKGFLLAALSVPLLIMVTVGLGTLTDRMRYNSQPVGYVDQSGWLANARQVPVEETSSLISSLNRPVALVAYPSTVDAGRALDAGEIQAYYVLAEDYAQTGKVELVYLKPPGRNATQQFYDFLRFNLVADSPPDVANRVVEGASLIVRSPDGVREQSDRAPMSFLFPLFLSLGFIMLFMSTSTTLAQALAEEKENRTIEVMVTSVSPGQLIGSKILAISAMGLTEVVAWAVLIAVSLLFGAKVLGIGWLAEIRIHPRTVAIILAIAAPSYALFSALMLAVAAVFSDPQESQQIGGMLSICFVAPFWAIMALVEQPHSLVAVGLSLFPLTALTTYCLLAAFNSVPLLQFAASLSILLVSAAGAIWLAGRAFRIGMLRYGQRVNLRELLHRAAGRTTAAGAAGGHG